MDREEQDKGVGLKVTEGRYKRASEYEWVDTLDGSIVYRCIGCYEKISFDEFRKEKGYCSKCRDGKNDFLYRERRGE